MLLRAGSSGFSYKEWKGPFYPEKLKDPDMLGYYAERLNTVEINNTFYRLPKAAMLEGWAAKVPDGFRFVLKASRRITHQQKLKDSADTVSYLFKTAEVLGERLGPVLFQLPPYLKKDVALLRDFLATIPDGRQATIEFRSRSWYDDEVFAALKDAGAALCVADHEEDDFGAPLLATADWGYLRLRAPDYTDADLASWAARIQGQPWSEVYVFFKHEDEGAAPKLAVRLNKVFHTTS